MYVFMTNDEWYLELVISNVLLVGRSAIGHPGAKRASNAAQAVSYYATDAIRSLRRR